MFREDIFLKALTERPETTRMMMQTFQPGWLRTAELQPILQEIYRFIKEYGVPPSISTLHEVFKKKDDAIYKARVKEILDQLDELEPDVSDVLYVIDQARDVAMTRSFADLTSSPIFSEMGEQYDGKGQLRELEKWMRKFQRHGEDDLDYDFKEAYEHLVQAKAEMVLSGGTPRIQCGINVVDQWAGGGLRPKNLAIALAPTGHGKSQFLMAISHHMASQGHKVLFISNELSMEEVTERFVSRATGRKLDDIMDDPNVGGALDHRWRQGFHKNLKLVECLREMDSTEIESLVSKYSFTQGWRPDVVVIDFMERMKPTVSGVKRDQSWNWFGYIAKDLVRIAKKNSWLVWTAGQTNRGGLDPNKMPSLADAQGSIQHLQEAALVITFRQNDQYPPEHKDHIMLEMMLVKSRHSKKPSKSVLVEADFSRVHITNKVKDKDDFKEDNEDAGKFPVKKKNDTED